MSHGCGFQRKTPPGFIIGGYRPGAKRPADKNCCRGTYSDTAAATGYMSDELTAARIVISTVGSREEAATIAGELVERRLAACVSQLPGLVSLYRWQGALEEAEEVLLLIKTSEERLPDLEAALRELHSYEVPEFLVFSVSAGSSAYLEWLFASVTKG
jgi:periplasmic divalent cation tolerance protein